MTEERRAERWLVTSGRTRLPVRTRSGADDTVVEVEIGVDDTARPLAATVLSRSGDTCVVSIAGRSTVVRLAPHGSGCHAMADGEAFAVASADDESTGSRSGVGSGAPATSCGVDEDALCTPMPATVSAILVEPGQVVQAGDALVRLEAMKMELAVRAPVAGRIASVGCRAGDLVQPGRPLVTLEPPPMRATVAADRR